MYRMKNKQKMIYGSIGVVAVLGVVNAGYLALTALAGASPVCNFIHGCDLVAASPYSRIFGIPLALFGVFFYSLITGFAFWGVCSKQVMVRMYILPLATIGFLLSLYFLYLQAFVIQAFCEYCLFSLFDATLLFVLSLLIPKERDGILDETSNTQKQHGNL